jgi:hypothetical protein
MESHGLNFPLMYSVIIKLTAGLGTEILGWYIQSDLWTTNRSLEWIGKNFIGMVLIFQFLFIVCSNYTGGKEWMQI